MGTSYLSMMESRLPPGFRFHPRDEELISDYLVKKLSGDSMSIPMLVDVDLNKVEPWDLPGESCVGGKEWYFYSLRDRKYATGQRTNRATLSGYWKATGKDRPIYHEAGEGGRLVGMRKTLVFYQGRAPKGKKSDWVMHEFRAESSPNITTASDHSHKRSSSSSTSKGDWVLCRVFYKSRGLSMKPSCNNNDHGHIASTSMVASASENCYDDTGSSSLPPLVDNTYINFEQPQHTTLQGLFNGQVPCFSTLLSSPHTPFPLLDNRQPMDAVRNQLVSFNDINPLMMGGLPGNQSRMEDGGHKPPMPPPEVSSESYLTEAGGQSMWASMCQLG